MASVPIRLFVLSALDAVAIAVLTTLVADGVYLLSAALGLITVGVNIVYLRPKLYPLRWLSPGLSLAALFALYPVVFTVYIAFTNYGDGHLLTKQQTVDLLEARRYVPDDAERFPWRLYRNDVGALLLVVRDLQNGFIAYPVREPSETPFTVVATRDGTTAEFPERVNGFTLLSRTQTVPFLSRVDGVAFGTGERTVTVVSAREVAQTQPRYRYDPARDTITDLREGVTFLADEQQGRFAARDGSTLQPGYRVPIGAANFARIVRSTAIRGPFLRIFFWTFLFATVSVGSTFLVGLMLAVLTEPLSPVTRKVLRSVFILPYAIPGVIGVLVWRGLLNPHVGTVTAWIEILFGRAPAWFSDPFWARTAILLVNLWLGFPYMLLVSSGALQSIPRALYEAAYVDGAGAGQVFFRVTLPMVLVAVGPIIISTFAMNFNNFNVIYLFNEGGPPIAGSPTPAGHTDILVSYTYRLAFESGRGSDFGFASAITVVIFVLLTIITLVNFRFTRVWEEVSENA